MASAPWLNPTGCFPLSNWLSAFVPILDALMNRILSFPKRSRDYALAGVFPMEEYRQRRQELEQRLIALDQQHRLVEAQTRQQMELSGICEGLTDFCQRVQAGLAEATFEQKRQLVELLIDRVVVTMDEVEIRYVIPTSPTSEQIRFCHLLTDYSSQRKVCR